jgi:hypothetical protein
VQVFPVNIGGLRSSLELPERTLVETASEQEFKEFHEVTILGIFHDFQHV